jgi:hypothetical protein
MEEQLHPPEMVTASGGSGMAWVVDSGEVELGSWETDGLCLKSDGDC